MWYINYCHSNPDTRIIFELNNHPYHETYKCLDGTIREYDGDGYLVIDFSPDFGEHGFDDGTFAVVSPYYHEKRGFCYSVRNPVSIFSALYDMFLHGKLSSAYLEGY